MRGGGGSKSKPKRKRVVKYSPAPAGFGCSKHKKGACGATESSEHCAYFRGEGCRYAPFRRAPANGACYGREKESCDGYCKPDKDGNCKYSILRNIRMKNGLPPVAIK